MGIRIINFKEVVNMSDREGQSWQDFLDFAYDDKHIGQEINSIFRAFLTTKVGNDRRKKYRKELLKY